jgi:hypothetical protein
MYIEAYAGRPEERVFLTQLAPTLAVYRSKVSKEQVREINDVGRMHGGILEMLMSESTKMEYVKFARNDPSWIESVRDRLVDITVVPDDFFPNVDHELCIFRDNVMLTDWSTETAILIHHHGLSLLILRAFRIVKDQGRTFDAHSFLNMLAEQIHPHSLCAK